MSYTKGPWRNGGEAILDEDGNWICQFFNKFEDDFDNGEANARLISKAPEMLGMLKELVDEFWGTEASPDSWNKIQKARTLISEIEGNEE